MQEVFVFVFVQCVECIRHLEDFLFVMPGCYGGLFRFVPDVSQPTVHNVMNLTL